MRYKSGKAVTIKINTDKIDRKTLCPWCYEKIDERASCCSHCGRPVPIAPWKGELKNLFFLISRPEKWLSVRFRVSPLDSNEIWDPEIFEVSPYDKETKAERCLMKISVPTKAVVEVSVCYHGTEGYTWYRPENGQKRIISDAGSYEIVINGKSGKTLSWHEYLSGVRSFTINQI